MAFNILLSKKKVINKLTYGHLIPKSGRTRKGNICVRAKKRFFKKKYRFIDFKRNLWNIPSIVIRIEYDPFRSSFLALLAYSNFILSYIICPENLIPGMFVYSSNIVPIKNGNSTYLGNIPIDVKIHNIESLPNKGAKYIRSAGCFAKIVERYKNFCIVKFNSGELKQFSNFCLATIGSISNSKWKYLKLKSAGDKQKIKNKKSIVRGVAKNAVDHPHGGGKGKKSKKAGFYSPWGKIKK